MAMNVRTLQRRLHQDGTSFQDLLDEIRRALALRMLAERRMPVARIACDVGFSEPSAFHRAFKRWTGLSPDAWRVQRRARLVSTARSRQKASSLHSTHFTEPAAILRDQARG